jgi:hypothetical protein
MISIIICSRQNSISPELRENIQQTIGIEFEIIIIDNSANTHTIFTAYNKGVALSRYPILLFMHDDIFYHTQNWGCRVADHFKQEEIGGIGVAGTAYIPFMPGGWWSSGIGHLYLLQSEGKNTKPFLWNNFEGTKEVVALDGVWFCIRRNLFDRIKFDEDTYKGFHFYDVDISLQVFHLGYKLLCVKDILIHHLSSGSLDEKWIENSLIFRKKWKDKLPVSSIPITLKERNHMEYRVLSTFTSDQLKLIDKDSKRKSEIYLFAVTKLLSFSKEYFYIKTPYWLAKFFFKYLRTLIS